MSPVKQRAVVPVWVNGIEEWHNVVAVNADDAKCRAGDQAARMQPGAEVRAGRANDIVWTGDRS